MSEKISFNCQIKSGKMKVSDRGRMEKYIFFQNDGDYILTIERKKRRRSMNQNAYYWVILEIIGRDLGYEPDELHATFKAMFLVDRTGKMPIVRSTSHLNSSEFSEYIEKIARKVAELGIVVPPAEIKY